MRSGTVGVGAFVVLAALVLPGPARACDIGTPETHSVDPTQVGVDQTPPQLAAPTVAEIRNNDSDNGCAPKCGWDHSARLINLATDDMTPAARIGYRVTKLAGVALHLSPSSGSAVLGGGDGSLTLLWDGDDDFDFTLQLIAIDAAGNESDPRIVRVSSGGGCSVAGRRVSNGFALIVVAFALVSAAARPLRRRPARRRRRWPSRT